VNPFENADLRPGAGDSREDIRHGSADDEVEEEFVYVGFIVALDMED
jgi:hypothetical protein